jgi:hypothetical protein
MSIKAIQTKYKGYMFRSRLEAKWAVFFDAIGWKWEYEKEGFEMSNGTKYLPDFYLPELKLWVEIKGEYQGAKLDAKLQRFCKESGEAILLLVGLPGATLDDDVPGWPQGRMFGFVRNFEKNETPKFHTMSCGFDIYADMNDVGVDIIHFCLVLFCPKYRNTDIDLLTNLKENFVPFHNYSFFFDTHHFSGLYQPSKNMNKFFDKARAAHFAIYC